MADPAQIPLARAAFLRQIPRPYLLEQREVHIRHKPGEGEIGTHATKVFGSRGPVRRPLFSYHRKVRPMIQNAPRGSHCGGKELCR